MYQINCIHLQLSFHVCCGCFEMLLSKLSYHVLDTNFKVAVLSSFIVAQSALKTDVFFCPKKKVIISFQK
jgi:hypothetical protein